MELNQIIIFDKDGKFVNFFICSPEINKDEVAWIRKKIEYYKESNDYKIYIPEKVNLMINKYV